MNLLETIHNYNSKYPDNKISLEGYTLLCMIRAAQNKGAEFTMTNEQLTYYLLSSEKTVRNTINRLCEAGFISKKRIKNRRALIYNIQQHIDI